MITNIFENNDNGTQAMINAAMWYIEHALGLLKLPPALQNHVIDILAH